MHVRIAVLATITTASCAGMESSPDARAVRVDRVELSDDGVPYFIRGALGTVAPGPDVLADAIPRIASMFQLSAADLVAQHVEHDRLGMTHVRYLQHKHGRRVVGGDLVVHVAADGLVRSVTSTARDSVASTVPSISEDTALDVARAVLAGVEIRRSELVYVIATSDAHMYLAWEVEAGTAEVVLDRVYVGADDGRIVDRRPQLFTARNRTIFDGHGGTYPFGTNPTQVGSEGQPPTDAIARTAYDNTGITYDCYQQLFQRDSYNGNGAVLKSLVHVKFLTPNGGSSGNNAAWTGNQMVYGDGDGNLMQPLALSLDVTAHELTHGVTSATAQLAYQNESGALNEGMSDILGAVCEAWHDGAVSADTWLIGEDIFTPMTAGDALRYMANPTQDASLYPPELGGSRDFYPDRYQGTQDNGGVHLNSGIPNLAFQLLVVGGKHPRDKTTFVVPGIGIAKAGAIFERALTHGYLTSNTNLAQARTATEEVAEELYPGGAEKTAVGMAWAAVGVGSPPGPDTQPPTVDITSPASGAAVVPGFDVAIAASDDRGVLRVELAIDGAVIGSDDTAPYTFATDAGLAAGTHTLRATAYDASNQASDTIEVTVNGGTCTQDSECPNGETCEQGTCQAGGSLDDDAGGCGCASGGPDASLLWLVAVLALRRRRR